MICRIFVKEPLIHAFCVGVPNMCIICTHKLSLVARPSPVLFPRRLYVGYIL